MSEPVWIPSLEDADQDRLSARIRTSLRAALPALMRDTGDVEINQPALGLTLRLKATRTRSIMWQKRPVFEVNFRGVVRSRDPETLQSVDLPIVGVGCLDINSGAILHLTY